MGADDATTVRLCGPLGVELSGRHAVLPGRQGRLAFAYLVVNRRRAVGRDELIELLWPQSLPADPGEALSALLSRVRRTVGADVLRGRRELELVLPSGRGSTSRPRWTPPSAPTRRSRPATRSARGAPPQRVWRSPAAASWPATRRRGRRIAAARSPSCGCARWRRWRPPASRSEAIGSPTPSAPRARRSRPRRFARAATGCSWRRSPGAATSAEALRAYDDLRVLLRDELGTAPGADVQALHRRLLDPTLPPGMEAPLAEAPSREARRLVTVLCAELTQLATPLDPEELRPVEAEAQRHACAVVEGFGATAHALSAGTLVAVFGAPVAHEDDAERAVRAGLRICELGLAGRAGVASGEAIVALGGPQAGTATGGMTSAAVALQRIAPPGGTRSTPPRATRPPTRCASSRSPGPRPPGAPPGSPGAAARHALRRPRPRAGAAARAARATLSRAPAAPGHHHRRGRGSARPG